MMQQSQNHVTRLAYGLRPYSFVVSRNCNNHEIFCETKGNVSFPHGQDMVSKPTSRFLSGLILGGLIVHLIPKNQVLRRFIQDYPGIVMNSSTLIISKNQTQYNYSLNETIRTPSELDLKNRKGFCRYLPHGISSSNMWNAHKEQILQATRANISGTGAARQITNASYPVWLENLFTLLHTRFLRLGYRSSPLPSNLREVLHILDAALEKREGWRALNVAVVGGSVTQGIGSCNDPFERMPLKSIPILACNWVYQLQKICDHFLGEGIVRITNLSVRGTSTSIATTIIKYKLYPDSVKGFYKNGVPDVIINAYGSNDAFAFLVNHTYAYDTDYQKLRRNTAQRFIRTCKESSPCPNSPFIIYFNDYIGNQQNLLLGEKANALYTQEISEWYGVMFINFASVAGRFTYANQKENIFSAKWSDTNNHWKVDVHFGLTGHLAIAWLMAYSSLSIVFDYCEDNYDDRELSKLFPEQYPQFVIDMVEKVMPPPLDEATRLQNVSEDWRKAWKILNNSNTNDCSENYEEGREPCAIALIIGPMGTIRSLRKLKTFVTEKTQNTYGWQAEDSLSSGEGFTNRLGFVAFATNATTTFFRDASPSEIRTAKVYYLKSYGEKWEQSQAHFILRGIHKGNIVTEKSFTLQGYHESNTSITYEHELKLLDSEVIPMDARIEVEVHLVNGTQFKINGLVVCN